MKRRRARQNAYAKNQLHSMIEKGDVAGLILALFSIVAVKTIATVIKVLGRLLMEIWNLIVATIRTSIFAIQLAVAGHRALEGSDERIRWFGRASILRAADILVFARRWPLVPNTFVARRVLKVAGNAAVIGLQAGDLTQEEARTWLARIKRQTMPESARAVEANSHPLYVKVRRPSHRASDIRVTSSSAGSDPPMPQNTRTTAMSVEDLDINKPPDEVSRLLEEQPEVPHHNRMAK